MLVLTNFIPLEYQCLISHIFTSRVPSTTEGYIFTGVCLFGRGQPQTRTGLPLYPSPLPPHSSPPIPLARTRVPLPYPTRSHSAPLPLCLLHPLPCQDQDGCMSLVCSHRRTFLFDNNNYLERGKADFFRRFKFEGIQFITVRSDKNFNS